MSKMRPGIFNLVRKIKHSPDVLFSCLPPIILSTDKIRGMTKTKDITYFTAALPPRGRLLALDHGSKTIGLAISDVERSIASPLDIIRKKKFSADLEQLQRILAEHAVCGLVIGYPLNLDGSEGSRCQSVRAFVRNLEQHIDLPMLLWDERFSSTAANDAMLEADLSRTSRKDKIDKVAASVFLQSLLDALIEID